MRRGLSTFCTFHFSWKSYYRSSLPKLEVEMNRGDDLKEKGIETRGRAGCRVRISQHKRYWEVKEKKDLSQEKQGDEEKEESGGLLLLLVLKTNCSLVYVQKRRSDRVHQ